MCVCMWPCTSSRHNQSPVWKHGSIRHSVTKPRLHPPLHTHTQTWCEQFAGQFIKFNPRVLNVPFMLSRSPFVQRKRTKNVCAHVARTCDEQRELKNNDDASDAIQWFSFVFTSFQLWMNVCVTFSVCSSTNTFCCSVFSLFYIIPWQELNTNRWKLCPRTPREIQMFPLDENGETIQPSNEKFPHCCFRGWLLMRVDGA